MANREENNRRIVLTQYSEIAKKILEIKMPMEQICKITELSDEEIKNIKQLNLLKTLSSKRENVPKTFKH